MRRQLSSILAIVAAAASHPANAQAPSTVETVFANPRHFTDFRVDRMRGPRQTERLVAELREWIEHEAPRYLPAGSKLTVTVTDVDMAGEFEPWRSTGLADVRVIREIYPSRVNLTFALADDTGKVVKEGERKLVSTVLYNTSMRVDDSTLRFEKSLLRDWLAREFSPGKGPAQAGR